VNYRTTEIELAAYLKARGHRLLAANQEGRLVTFTFESGASAEADGYFLGSQVPARELFEAYRHLRVLIQQLRQHVTHRIGEENLDPTSNRN
jgi:hypothetical protein